MGMVCYADGSVAPLAGAWIEIHKLRHNFATNYVAPLAGAWIEIPNLKG